jgi:uncharacterized protein (UPF0264 family)
VAELLVSVRNAQEAVDALAGGAALIDVKEPARGPLGYADREVIEAVIAAVAGRRAVSAACGELAEHFTDLPSGLAYIKRGLAGCAAIQDWQARLLVASRVPGASRQRPEARTSPSAPPEPVAVAYADCQLANAPHPDDVLSFACEQRWTSFLLDTYTKDGRTLLDCMTLREIVALCRRCRSHGVRVALAGSLRADEIRLLIPVEPHWFAVRSAACLDGRRDQPICQERVRALVRVARGK